MGFLDYASLGIFAEIFLRIRKIPIQQPPLIMERGLRPENQFPNTTKLTKFFKAKIRRLFEKMQTFAKDKKFPFDVIFRFKFKFNQLIKYECKNFRVAIKNDKGNKV